MFKAPVEGPVWRTTSASHAPSFVFSWPIVVALPDKGLPDLLSEPMVDWMVDEDNLRDALELSGYSPVANATALQPNGYSQHHTLAQRSRRPRAVCYLLISNGTTDYTQTLVAKSLDRNKVDRLNS